MTSAVTDVSLAAPLVAQTTAFSYQGQLNAGGVFPTGQYQFTFTLYDAVTGDGIVSGTMPIQQSLQVINGLFTTDLDFGQIFNGTQYWLDIQVGTLSTNEEELSARQPIDVVPVAQYALNSPAGTAGPTGATGPQGATGAAGVQGPQGQQGSQGAQGSQGLAGLNGENGAQGPQGTAGTQGTQGPQGATGAAGGGFSYSDVIGNGVGAGILGSPTWLNESGVTGLEGNAIYIAPAGCSSQTLRIVAQAVPALVVYTFTARHYAGPNNTSGSGTIIATCAITGTPVVKTCLATSATTFVAGDGYSTEIIGTSVSSIASPIAASLYCQ